MSKGKLVTPQVTYTNDYQASNQQGTEKKYLRSYTPLSYAHPRTIEYAGNYFTILKASPSNDYGRDKIYISMESHLSLEKMLAQSGNTCKWFDKPMLKSLIDYLQFTYDTMGE